MNETPTSLPQLAAMLRESPLDDAAAAPDGGLERALTRALGPLLPAAPAPSAELRLLLDRDLPGDGAAPAHAPDHQERSDAVPSLRVRGRRALAGALVLAVSGVGATGLSAAANTLPGPWQRQVSDFSRVHLPFDFPEPPAREGDGPLSSSAATAGTTTPGHDARNPDVEAPVRLAARPATLRDRTEHAGGERATDRAGAPDRSVGGDRADRAPRSGGPAGANAARPGQVDGDGDRGAGDRPRRPSVESPHHGRGEGAGSDGDQTTAPRSAAAPGDTTPEDGPDRATRPSRGAQQVDRGPTPDGSPSTQGEHDDERGRRPPETGDETGDGTGNRGGNRDGVGGGATGRFRPAGTLGRVLDLPGAGTPGRAG